MLTRQIAEIAKTRLPVFPALVATLLSFIGYGSGSDDDEVTNNAAKELDRWRRCHS